MSELTIGEKRSRSEAVKMDIESAGNGTNIPFSEFVVVSDSNGDPMELPTAQDNSLSMATLQASYPGATGLKFKNAKTGALRAVAVDSSGTKMLPPLDGWDDKVFVVIFSNTRAERVREARKVCLGSDVSVKRRKIGTSDGDSDSDGEGRVGRKRAADARDQPVMPRRPVDLIVLGVNFKTTDEDFKKYFETFGTVVFAEIKRNADGSSKGFGFVQMSSVEEEDKVMGFCDHMIDGRRCEIRFPDQKHTDSSANPYGPPRKTLVNKIFVGRLTEKITEETLRDFFNKEAKQVKEAAAVTNILIPRPFRGFAFVTFTHAEVADRMVKANNFVIDGMSVVVTYAVPRENHQAAANAPPGFNDFAAAYGYGKGGAGYDEAPLGLIPFASREMFGYSPPSGMYPRPSYEGWATPPTNMQGTPRSGRGADQTRGRHPGKDGPAAAYPGGPMHKGQPPLPYMYPRDPREGMAGQAASNQIASGLDALNLNQKNPELISAAWNAFFKTLNHAGGTPQSHKQW
ncbi:unnamed protein product [Haemonchus placei]|uniref:RRM domain-containing protein n=1 Tax=Haemonchus placei TaxID=6290 RepID=A0A0N4X1P5_HAEPC|nr:unnamed protein product [Haemonchus placei]